MRYTELGKRVKEYESLTTGCKLMKGLGIIARLDGKSFHTFCRGLKKPFCYEFVETMQEVTKFLVEETHAQLGYVQSDEISLCWLDVDKAPFDGKLFKLHSVLASLATSKFVSYINNRFINQILPGLADMYSVLDKVNETMPSIKINEDRIQEYLKSNQWYLLYEKCQKIIPSFDCRVFQLPNETELANTFIWRELDASRNSISMLAQANFSHKSLQGLTCKDMQNKLLTEKNINWNDLSPELKRGTYFKRILVEKELEDEVWDKIPDDKKPKNRKVIRSEVQKVELPVMKNIENKAGVYFHDEKPVQKIYESYFYVNKTLGYKTICPKCQKVLYFSTARDTVICPDCEATIRTTELKDNN